MGCGQDQSKPVIGMLHIPALPVPSDTLGFGAIVDWVGACYHGP